MDIPESEVERIVGGRAEVKEVRAAIYARVSSSEQRSDLEGQTQYLTQYCSAKGYRVVDILSDVASGLNTSRRGLRGDGSNAPSPVGLPVDGRCVPFTSTAAHDPAGMPLWARWKSLPQTEKASI